MNFTAAQLFLRLFIQSVPALQSICHRFYNVYIMYDWLITKTTSRVYIACGFFALQRLCYRNRPARLPCSLSFFMCTCSYLCSLLTFSSRCCEPLESWSNYLIMLSSECWDFNKVIYSAEVISAQMTVLNLSGTLKLIDRQTNKRSVCLLQWTLPIDDSRRWFRLI